MFMRNKTNESHTEQNTMNEAVPHLSVQNLIRNETLAVGTIKRPFCTDPVPRDLP